MNTRILDRLLRVRLEAPEDHSEFDVKEAVHCWGRAKIIVYSINFAVMYTIQSLSLPLYIQIYNVNIL